VPLDLSAVTNLPTMAEVDAEGEPEPETPPTGRGNK
jgi:hypothetical protein